MKPLFYGAAAATILGLLFGAGLKAEISPRSSYGQQLLVSKPQAREATAFDAWYPSSGPPMPWMELAALPQGEDLDALDRQIEHLLRRASPEGESPARADGREAPATAAEPVEYAGLPPRPEPYLPSAQGDILAADQAYRSAAYEPPPALPPSWGWALPDASGPPPAGPGAYAPPPVPGAAAG